MNKATVVGVGWIRLLFVARAVAKHCCWCGGQICLQAALLVIYIQRVNMTPVVGLSQRFQMVQYPDVVLQLHSVVCMCHCLYIRPEHTSVITCAAKLQSAL